MGSRRDAGRGVTCTTRCSSTCTSAHLKVALRLADHDHLQRPNGSTGRLLATVLHAVGHHERAQTLTAALEQRAAACPVHRP